MLFGLLLSSSCPLDLSVHTADIDVYKTEHFIGTQQFFLLENKKYDTFTSST